MTYQQLQSVSMALLLAIFSPLSIASEQHHFSLDISQLSQSLNTKDNQLAQRKSIPSIQLPLPNGKIIKFLAEETQVLPTKLAKKYPTIKTYKITPTETTEFSGRMSLLPQGVYVSVYSKEGREATINPEQDDSKNYISQWEDENTSSDSKQYADDQLSSLLPQDELPKFAHRSTSDISSRLIQYRVAVAANYDYVASQGGSVAAALASISHTLNRVNFIFERDLGVHLILVENNDLLIFNTIENDPYEGSLHEMAYQNQEVIDRIIGSDNYDLGHLFAAQGGGAAYVRSACTAGVKAIAVSANLAVGSERFATEFVAHEMGHQLGASHTFSSNKGLCTSNAFAANSAYEPGSGASIMSYVGLCGTDNLQAHADSMFHIGSIEQANRHKQETFDQGCGQDIGTMNYQASTDAGSDFTIPTNTAFELSANISSENDFTSYSWQQMDSGGQVSELNEDTGYNALFRSFYPQRATTRHFPELKQALQGQIARGELLPQQQRQLNFRFIAHLKQGGSLIDDMKITTIDTGKQFKINTTNTSYQAGSTLKLTWNVADTDKSPINCASIDVSLTESKDQPIFEILATHLANNGSASIKLTKTYSANSVFKIQCSNNIFYALSTKTPNSSTTTSQPTPARSTTTQAENSNGGGGSLSIYFLLTLLLLTSYQRQRKYLIQKKVTI